MAEQNLQPAKVIAKIFGVTTRRIEQLKSEGIIIGQGKPTKYDLMPTVMLYIRYLSDKAYGREQKQNVADLEEEKLRAEVAIKKAKSESAALELAELKGKLHRAEDVEAITADHVLYIRSMLMAMPGKLAVDCANKTAPEVAECIQREIYYILNNLTDYRYDPDEYAKRVRQRQGWEDERHGDGEED